MDRTYLDIGTNTVTHSLPLSPRAAASSVTSEVFSRWCANPFTLLLVPLLAAILPVRSDASIAYYVGKNLTADGSVLLGGYGDEPSSHWLEIVPPREFAHGTMLEVGVTPETRYPGERFEIPQVPRTTWARKT